MPIRTFVAVDVSNEVRQGALRLLDLLRPAAGEVKWVDSENLHWTLQFLGNLDVRHIPEVCDAVARGAMEVEAFEIEARGAGAFPSPERPRTLWIGAGQGERNMTVLHAAVEKCLRKRGYRGEERRFVPHLTLGRARGKALANSLTAELIAQTDYDAGTMLVDEVTVYASELTREGPTYRVLSRAPLAGS